MARTRNLLQDFLSTIADLRPTFSSSKDERSIEDLSTDLLKGEDETSQQRLGRLILGTYEELDDEEKKRFFRFLTDEMDLDSQQVITYAQAYQSKRDAATLAALLQSAEPIRQRYLRRLNQVEGATQVLVHMRADLLRFAKTDKSLKIADLDFAHLFTSWFNRGFLTIQPISWHTPANILAKIIKYEAVHAINDWDDLRSRLQPDDRRCYAFFHPAMPEEPLVFVEVALCRGIPSSIQNVLEERDSSLMHDEVDTAAFYSISNCQRGLQGISFGNSLIKQVVADLSKEIPTLKQFVTLSPLPGFAAWAKDNADSLADGALPDIEQAASLALRGGDHTVLASFNKAVNQLAARYLLEAKRPDGQPVDAVARFHLRNGACVYALHPLADLSDNGIKNSFGVMVNYAYELADVASRHENYMSDHLVVASKQVANLTSNKSSSFFRVKD